MTGNLKPAIVLSMSTQSNPTDRAVDAAQALGKAVNDMSFDSEAFAIELSNEHRTLQQVLVGALLTTVIKMAENSFTHGTDARNEASARVCVAVRDFLQADEKLFIKDGVVKFPFV